MNYQGNSTSIVFQQESLAAETHQATVTYTHLIFQKRPAGGHGNKTILPVLRACLERRNRKYRKEKKLGIGLWCSSKIEERKNTGMD
jgi:hypothetical protein